MPGLGLEGQVEARCSVVTDSPNSAEKGRSNGYRNKANVLMPPRYIRGAFHLGLSRRLRRKDDPHSRIFSTGEAAASIAR